MNSSDTYFFQGKRMYILYLIVEISCWRWQSSWVPKCPCGQNTPLLTCNKLFQKWEMKFYYVKPLKFRSWFVMTVFFFYLSTQRVIIIAWMPKHIRFTREGGREGEREKDGDGERERERESSREKRRERGAEEKENKRAGFILKRVSFGRLKGQAVRLRPQNFYNKSRTGKYLGHYTSIL